MPTFGKLGPGRLAGVLCALVGFVGSLWLMLPAAQSKSSPVSSVWVVSPFAMLLLLCGIYAKCATLTRAALVFLVLAVTAGTLTIFGSIAGSSDGPKVAFPFIVVPLGSWCLIATVVPVASLISRRLSRYRLVRWMIRGIAGGFALVVLGVSTLLGLLLFDHHQDTILPAPTGPFAVGRATFVWQRDQVDPAVPSDERQLLGWIWYPAASEQRSEPVDYLPVPWRVAMEKESGTLLSQFLTRDLARVHAHSLRDAPVSPERSAYPVVLMRGGGAALTTDYTTLAEDLASHGYVVAGLDAPHRSWVAALPDGRIVSRAPRNNLDNFDGPEVDRLAEKLARAWTADCRFVLDQLGGLNASDPTGKFRGPIG